VAEHLLHRLHVRPLPHEEARQAVTQVVEPEAVLLAFLQHPRLHRSRTEIIFDQHIGYAWLLALYDFFQSCGSRSCGSPRVSIEAGGTLLCLRRATRVSQSRFYTARPVSVRLPWDPSPRNISSSRASGDVPALAPARKASAIFPAWITAFNFSSAGSANSATAPKIADIMLRFSAGASGRSRFDFSPINIDFTQWRRNPSQPCWRSRLNERLAGMPGGSDSGTSRLAADLPCRFEQFRFHGNLVFHLLGNNTSAVDQA